MKETKVYLQEECKKRFDPVLSAVSELIQRNGDIFAISKPLVIGIDGMCASGKTTLGYYLQQEFGGNLFHMDDFFLQDHQRTKERLSEVGGNVDYERFREEVLDRIVHKKPVLYRPFDCTVRKIQEGREVSYLPLNFVEGSYSLHPYFGEIYDLKIFLDMDKEKQMEMIRIRNGESMLQRFVSEWIPKENAYFEAFQIGRDCIQIHWKHD